MRVIPAVRSSLLMLGVALALSACNPPSEGKGSKSETPKETKAEVVSQADGEFTGIKNSVRQLFSGQEATLIKESPIKGLYEVHAVGNLFYASPDGKYFIQGDMIEASTKVSQTQKSLQESLSELRKGPLKEIDVKDSITFKAKGPEKAEVYVFTDTDCGYCRKLHQEIGEVTAGGITVHYFPWPRSGKQGPTYDTMQSVWCAKDKQKALTDAKNGKTVPSATCDNPVDKYIDLGHKLFVNGTPAIFSTSGQQLGGYLPAPQLIQSAIQAKQAQDAAK